MHCVMCRLLLLSHEEELLELNCARLRKLILRLDKGAMALKDSKALVESFGSAAGQCPCLVSDRSLPALCSQASARQICQGPPGHEDPG